MRTSIRKIDANKDGFRNVDLDTLNFHSFN